MPNVRLGRPDRSHAGWSSPSSRSSPPAPADVHAAGDGWTVRTDDGSPLGPRRAHDRGDRRRAGAGDRVTRRVAGREAGPIGLGCMGMSWAYDADLRDDADVGRGHPPRARPRRDAARHRRRVRAVHERGARRRGRWPGAASRRPGHQVRHDGRGRQRVPARPRRAAGARARGDRRLAAPAAAPTTSTSTSCTAWTRRAVRGDLGRDGGGRRRRQGARARHVGGGRRRARARPGRSTPSPPCSPSCRCGRATRRPRSCPGAPPTTPRSCRSRRSAAAS